MHGLSSQAFHWTYTGVFGMILVLVIYLVLSVTKTAPSIDTIRQFADIMSDRGGVILVLSLMSIFFFVQSMRLFYVLIDLISAKQLDVQNAVALMAIQFASNSAFGMAFGAMLKTMNGNAPPAPAGQSDAPAAAGAPKPPIPPVKT
jgi:hypothetical protein